MVIFLLIFSLFFAANLNKSFTNPYVVVLGIAQDGGAPHAGCIKECCEEKWDNPTQYARVSSIGIVDPVTKESWIIDATPDFALQLTALDNQLSGIFLTHAHIGHYTGLIHLGREVMGAKEIPVYAMPKMKTFLESNGPWNQLVALNNISINEISDKGKINLNERLSITPFLVPHRDEYSETVGYKIEGPNKSLVFIPDIDKWQKWDQDIKEVVSNNTYSLLDGTFYDIDELPGRDMSEIPHPFIVESMDLFSDIVNKSGVYFIHLNHSNPALDSNSNAFDNIKKNGFHIAQRDQLFDL
ncbi:MAG TPA: pyrroloquinoline quinone biosynthesis protein PqqB [Candidatus Marinimicrobia bacterium]|nr:pyrroloquinoline quinone biosynthesis protein PqqB [Candidatus Neomarinimicrobiota bacterium]